MVIIGSDTSHGRQVEHIGAPVAVKSYPTGNSSCVVGSKSDTVTQTGTAHQFVPPSDSMNVDYSIPHEPASSDFGTADSTVEFSRDFMYTQVKGTAFSWASVSMGGTPL